MAAVCVRVRRRAQTDVRAAVYGQEKKLMGSVMFGSRDSCLKVARTHTHTHT